MSEKATPKSNANDMHIERIELNDTQLERISGGGYIEGEARYICDKCGTECVLVDVNHNYIAIFECPNCGARYSTW